ncbi:ribonuclease H-like domain-containing protein [Tanacetum coccineum]
MPRDCLAIIESKSKVRYSRSKAIVSKVSTRSSTPGVSPDVVELKDMVRDLLLDKKNQSQAPATVKAVEESCVTCGGAHSYRNCPATDANVYRDNIQEYVSQAAAVNYNHGNTGYHPPMVANQIRPPASTSGSGSLSSNTVANPKSDLKAITTRSGVSYVINLHPSKLNMSGSQDEIPPPPPPPPSSSQTPTQQTPHTVSTIKLPILGEYDIWAMKMEHYLGPIQTIIWEVIQMGMVLYQITKILKDKIKVLPPRTAEEIVARERERKARTTLLMALPEDHLAKFHKMTDAKEILDAIKSRFGGNDESKKMQKYILKQHFEGFSVIQQQKGLHKAMTGVDSLSFDDLYNNLRVFESDVKGSTASSSSRKRMHWFLRTPAGNNDNMEQRRTLKSWFLVHDGEGVDWTSHSEEDEDYALMACNSSESDTEVTSCSNKCKESYANLKKLYDAQREQLSDASIEIKAYSQGLKKVEAQLVAHQQGQLWYEQKIKFMKIDLDDKTDVLTYHKKLLAEAQKEKEDLKAKVEKWHNSSKNLSKLLNTQMSANDKFGLGYGDHRYDGILSYGLKFLQSVFMNKESELEKQPLYDRFVTAGGMHAVPPPMTGNYMPSGPDIEVDYSQFTYGPKQTQPSESESQSSEFDTCESNISTKPSELVSEPVVNESNVGMSTKIWSNAPISEEETVKNQFTHSQKPKVDKKELGLVLLGEEGLSHRALKNKELLIVDVPRHMIGKSRPTCCNFRLLMVALLLLEVLDCSLMYLNASRPDIMLQSRVSFDLEAYSDSDYAGANLDRKSTTGGCQFLGRRLISWQCKKQTIVATSTTEAEYVAAARAVCGRFGIQIRLLTMGFRELLRIVINGTEAFLLPTLFILWLDTVSTAGAKYVTALRRWKKIYAKVKYLLRHKTDPSPDFTFATIIPVSIPESSGGNFGGHFIQVINPFPAKFGKEEIPQRNNGVHKESVSKQARRNVCKGELQSIEILFLIRFLKTHDYMVTENASRMTGKKDSTDEQSKGTDDHTKEGSATQTTQTPTSTIFGDDETIAKVLLNMSQAKQIDPKDKGKKENRRGDESEKKVQEEWEGEEERNRLAEEKANNEALIRNYDDIKARIDADRLLAEKLQEEEREQFTIVERAKFPS